MGNQNLHRRGPPIPKIPPWLLEAIHIAVQAAMILAAGALLGVLARTGGAPPVLYENIPVVALALAFLNTLRRSFPFDR
jgi:hypothetical protein